MKKFMKALPIVLILALVLAISVSANAESFLLGTRQYYSKSQTVNGYNGACTMWVDKTSGCRCSNKLYGYTNINYPNLVHTGYGYPGERAHVGGVYNHDYYSWYGYMQPLSSSGLGGSATGQVAAE